MAKASKKGFGFSIGLSIEDFQKNANALVKVGKKTARVLDETFQAVSNLSKTALAGFATALAGVAAASAKFGAEMDNVKTALEGVYGSAEIATKKYRDLQLITETTGYGIAELQRLDKELVGIGYSAEGATTILTRLSNAAIATGGGVAEMQRVAEQLLNISVSGQISARSLRYFAEMGLEVKDLIGKDVGTVIEQLIVRLKKFDNVALGESSDLWQQWSRAISIVKDAFAELGNYINDNFKGYGVALIDVIDNLRTRFANLLAKDGLYSVFTALQDIAAAITIVALPALLKLSATLAPFAIKIALTASAILAVAEAFHDLRNEANLLKYVQASVGRIFKFIEYDLKVFLKSTQLNFAKWQYDLLSSFNSPLLTSGHLSALSNIIVDLSKEIRTLQIEGTNVGEILHEQQETSIAKFGQNAYLTKLINQIKELGDITSSTSVSDFERLQMGKIGKPKVTIKNTVQTEKENIEKKDVPFSPEYWLNLAGYTSLAEAQKDFADKSTAIFSLFFEGAKNALSPLAAWLQEFQVNIFDRFAVQLNEALWSSKNVIHELGKSLQDLGRHILMQVSQMLLLTSIFRMLGIGSGTAAKFGVFTMPTFKNVGDAIVQPDGTVVHTDPRDYLIATKTPSTLLSKDKAQGAAVVINVNNNAPVEVSATSSFDGVRTIVDLFIEGYARNVSGIKGILGG